MLKTITILLFVMLLTRSTSAQEATPEADQVYVNAVVWSPDGTQIAVVDSTGHIRVYAVETGKVVSELYKEPDNINSITWSPDGSRLASISRSDGVIRVWDVINRAVVAELDGDQCCEDPALIAWSPDGKFLASLATRTDGSYPIRLWAIDGDIFSLTPMTISVSAYDMAWSPDGTYLAITDVTWTYLLSGFSEGTLKVQQVVPFQFFLSWSFDSSKLATYGFDGTIQVVDPVSGTAIETIEGIAQNGTRDTASIAWLADNRTIIADQFDGSAQLWNVYSKDALNVLNLRRQGGRWLMAVSPQGGRIAFASSGDSQRSMGDNQNGFPAIVRSLANDAVQIVVPAPSVELLQSITERCAVQPAVEQELAAPLAANDLEAFVAEVEALPDTAMPPGCAADLVAVAEALGAQ
jgi:WD40 repeat protein